MGTAGGSGSGPRTWDTLAQPAETHPRTHNLASTQLTSRKKHTLAFWLVLAWLRGLAGLAADRGTAPDGGDTGCGALERLNALIAQ